MKTVNLRDFYYWHTHDEIIEVSDEVAAEMLKGRRSEKTQERAVRRNKVHSIDVDDGTEEIASIHIANSPDAILEMKERHCRLCRALNSLPDIQGRRIDAHFFLGMSQAEIAKFENVTKGSVSVSISRGLKEMKTALLTESELPCCSSLW